MTFNLRELFIRKLIKKTLENEKNLFNEIENLYRYVPDKDVVELYKRKCVKSKPRITKMNLTKEEEEEFIRKAEENMPPSDSVIVSS